MTVFYPKVWHFKKITLYYSESKTELEYQLQLYRTRLQANQQVNDHLVKINGFLVDTDKKRRKDLVQVMKSAAFKNLDTDSQGIITKASEVDHRVGSLLTEFLELLREQRADEEGQE